VTVYYLDSSVWVKRYYEEGGTERVRELFSAGHSFACSDLGFVEVAATLSRKHRAGQISAESRDQGLIDLERDWRQFVQIVPIDHVITAAVRLARDHALRGSDAIHLASALLVSQRLTGSGHRAVLATCDRELKRAAQEVGLLSFDPEETASSLSK
jgi:predicted nucleic acid-binding protein